MLSPILTIGEVRDAPGGLSVLDRWFPSLLEVPPDDVRWMTISSLFDATPGLRDDPSARDQFWAELEAVIAPPSTRQDDNTGSTPVGASGPRGSAPWNSTGEPTQWGLLEIALHGPADGNPFIDIELSAEFRSAERTYRVGGFYDGNGVYRLRVLADQEGRWTFATSSTAPELDGVHGEVIVGSARPDAHGPVRVDGFHFEYADGTRYRPWGTTAYAWTHQDDATQHQTLETLASSPFTKLRMCLFPKHFIYNTNEPSDFPFPRGADGAFDHSRFDPAFFARLDERIEALDRLGIEADVVLFHPYDRWGFANLGATVDDRVVRYVVRRLAGYANIWFSLANEYDLMIDKATADWERIGELVAAEDPHGHPVSIHNWIEFYDHGRPWITHASVQRADVEQTGEWRERWGKPVVVDECGYEGNTEHGWGNLSGEELVRRLWVGALLGGYVGHGETYWNADEQLWWSKGGRLHGTSPRRIEFLAGIVDASPTGVLEPQPSNSDAPWAGVPDEYLVSYYGSGRPRERHVLLPPGRWHVDVLDTWECTVERLPGEHEHHVIVPLPSRSYMAIRLVAV